RGSVTGEVGLTGLGVGLQQTAEVRARASNSNGRAVLLGHEADQLGGGEPVRGAAGQLLGGRHGYPLAVGGYQLGGRVTRRGGARREYGAVQDDAGHARGGNAAGDEQGPPGEGRGRLLLDVVGE